MNELDHSSIYEITNENLPLINKKKKSTNNLLNKFDKHNIDDVQNIVLPKVKNSKKKISTSSLNSINSDFDNISETEFVKEIELNTQIFNEEEKRINEIERSKSIEQLKKQEWCCCFFVLVSIIVALIYQEINMNPSSLSTSNNKLYKYSINFLLIISSLSTIFYSKIFFFFIFSFSFY